VSAVPGGGRFGAVLLDGFMYAGGIRVHLQDLKQALGLLVIITQQVLIAEGVRVCQCHPRFPVAAVTAHEIDRFFDRVQIAEGVGAPLLCDDPPAVLIRREEGVARVAVDEGRAHPAQGDQPPAQRHGGEVDLDGEGFSHQEWHQEQGGLPQGEIVDIVVDFRDDALQVVFLPELADVIAARCQPKVQGEVVKPGAARPGHACAEDDLMGAFTSHGRFRILIELTGLR